MIIWWCEYSIYVITSLNIFNTDRDSSYICPDILVTLPPLADLLIAGFVIFELFEIDEKSENFSNSRTYCTIIIWWCYNKHHEQTYVGNRRFTSFG